MRQSMLSSGTGRPDFLSCQEAPRRRRETLTALSLLVHQEQAVTDGKSSNHPCCFPARLPQSRPRTAPTMQITPRLQSASGSHSEVCRFVPQGQQQDIPGLETQDSSALSSAVPQTTYKPIPCQSGGQQLRCACSRLHGIPPQQ